MTNVCPHCGEYSSEKEIRPGPSAMSLAVCPFCGGSAEFLSQPLFVLTGPSGCGKTTLARSLVHDRRDLVVFESDVLWNGEFAREDTLLFRDHCLRTAKNIGQAGRPVLLCGSAGPGEYEQCAESRYFSRIHYIALIASGDEIERRLKARPAWRESGSEDFIRAHREWADWFRRREFTEDVTLLDTTDVTVGEALVRLREWLDRFMPDLRQEN